MSTTFDLEYERLNTKQKEAVDTIEGPVMVIAGPGTGKTQVISLRIGNILKKTDTQADGILCLTFTNSGVEAMRKRLYEYIGPEAGNVNISTFHAFGNRLIDEYFHVLGLPRAPRLLGNEDTLALIDHILSAHEWQYIRPRHNIALYFRDLKSLISLLVRERMSPDDLLEAIRKDQQQLKDDPENISSRGARKGDLKMEVVNKIESLEKTCEVVTFYKLYEEQKRLENVMDYDDVLRYMVRLVSESDDVRDTVRERYLYVLVDEHQDSSGIQNEFLRQVWGEVESPNVFVVGDDRQLIYGFSGASLSYFEEFKSTFGGTRVITLTDNYRSTQRILDVAEHLLTSSLAEGKLVSQSKVDEPLELVECQYPRDEILAAGAFFTKKMQEGVLAEECVLIVPKNSQVRSAALVLRDLGLPVSASGSERLFSMPEVRSFLTILRIIADPFSGVHVAESVLDPLSNIPTLAAHEFLHYTPSRHLSVEDLLKEGETSGLMADVNPLYQWGLSLKQAIELAENQSVYELIQSIGKTFLLDTASDHDTFVRRVEIVRSFLHLASALEEFPALVPSENGQGKSTSANVRDFLTFLARMEEYGEDIPLAVFGAETGIRIKTMHASKGLEFDAVWIAHLNERSLMSGKRSGFTLPESIKILEEKKDEATAKREVYVAVTRAKRFCVLSYARMSYQGGEERLAAIIEALPREIFITKTATETETALLAAGPEHYVINSRAAVPMVTKHDLQKLVSEKYTKKKVSVTLLNNFYECPWKWYFRSFLEVPEPLSGSLEFGSVVHAAIEHLIKLDKKPTKKDIDAAILEAIENSRVSDPVKIRHMTHEAEIAVKRFVTVMLPELYDKRESEKSLSHKESLVPELTIYGKIDLIEMHEGDGVRVTDFKTGKTRKASEIEKSDEEGRMSTYMRQLAMYSYLVHHALKGSSEVEASRLYFVEESDPEKSNFETHIDEEKIDLLLQDIKDYDALMQSGEWTERTCTYKPHQGETGCPYCQKAVMYT